MRIFVYCLESACKRDFYGELCICEFVDFDFGSAVILNSGWFPADSFCVMQLHACTMWNSVFRLVFWRIRGGSQLREQIPVRTASSKTKSHLALVRWAWLGRAPLTISLKVREGPGSL